MILFVSGIDTGIGKTIATGLMAAWFQEQGHRPITQKLVQTGCQITSDDIQVHRRLMGVEPLPEDNENTTCPLIYSFPASPHLAAALAGDSIDTERIVACARRLAACYDIVLVEGAGGLCVPLTHDTVAIDFVAQQKWPVILVSAPRLGSINHTLLSLEAIHTRGIELAAIIFNLHLTAAPEIVTDTRRLIREAVARMGSDAPVIDLPRNVDVNHTPPWNEQGLRSLLRYAKVAN